MLETLSESEGALLFDFLRELAGKARTEFAQGKKPNEWIEKPLPIFIDFLVSKFDWARSTARNKAVKLIEELWNADHLEYFSNGKRIAKLKITHLPPWPIEIVVVAPKPPAPQAIQAIVETVTQPAKAKSPEEIANEKGERNEKRFYELMWMLGDAIAKLTNVIKKFEVRRSRKWSQRDMGGEDVAIFIKTSRKKWIFRRNVKSSWAYAESFILKKKALPKPKKVSDKIDAVVVHEFKSDREIIERVVNNFIKAGLVELKSVRRLIAYQFSTNKPPSQ